MLLRLLKLSSLVEITSVHSHSILTSSLDNFVFITLDLEYHIQHATYRSE